MTKITLTNDFHNTAAVVIPQPYGKDGRRHFISHKTALRLSRELCGIDGCRCGGTFGERGGTRLEIVTENYDRDYIIDLRYTN